MDASPGSSLTVERWSEVRQARGAGRLLPTHFLLPAERRGTLASMAVTAADLPNLTNLDKVFWPDEGYTKLDLLAYYQHVAPVILPYLVDRPQALCRRPDRWQGKEFYQRISRGQPAWVPTAPILVERGRRAKPFVLCNDLRTLMWMVNFGCIDLNPWASRVGSIDRLDYLVIDLDPSHVAFDVVVEVALEVHRLLDRIGAANYCKTSGKSGLHIFVPLAGRCDAPQAKLLGQLVGALVNRRLPELTTLDSRRYNAVHVEAAGSMCPSLDSIAGRQS